VQVPARTHAKPAVTTMRPWRGLLHPAAGLRQQALTPVWLTGDEGVHRRCARTWQPRMAGYGTAVTTMRPWRGLLRPAAGLRQRTLTPVWLTGDEGVHRRCARTWRPRMAGYGTKSREGDCKAPAGAGWVVKIFSSERGDANGNSRLRGEESEARVLPRPTIPRLGSNLC
jgi:hypothetical protein